MRWQPTGRELATMTNRETARHFLSWLAGNPGYVPASWAWHLLGMARATVSTYQSRGQIRVVRFVFPDKKILTLVSLQDCARIVAQPRRQPGKDRRRQARPAPDTPSTPKG